MSGSTRRSSVTGGISKGTDHLDGRLRCQRWFAVSIPVCVCERLISIRTDQLGVSHKVGVREAAAHTRPSLMAGLSDPRINFCAADVKSARPAIGRYSWFRLGSFRRISSACVHCHVLISLGAFLERCWRSDHPPSSQLARPMVLHCCLCMRRCPSQPSFHMYLCGMLPSDQTTGLLEPVAPHCR